MKYINKIGANGHKVSKYLLINQLMQTLRIRVSVTKLVFTCDTVVHELELGITKLAHLPIY